MSEAFLYATESEPPSEPGLYGVIWGGGDEDVAPYMDSEAIYISKTGRVSILGTNEFVNLHKAPWNHPHTRYTKRLKIRPGKPEHYGVKNET